MLNFVKGAIIGIALVIPGLSGSIFAVVVGLYDRLLNAVNHFRDDPKKKYAVFDTDRVGCCDRYPAFH